MATDRIIEEVEKTFERTPQQRICSLLCLLFIGRQPPPLLSLLPVAPGRLPLLVKSSRSVLVCFNISKITFGIYLAYTNTVIEFPKHPGMLIQWIQAHFRASFYFDIFSQQVSHILTPLRNLGFFKWVITGNFFSNKMLAATVQKIT